MKTDYAEYCPKSKSNNIIFCPEDIIKRKNDTKIQWLNDWFKDAIAGKIKFGKSSKSKNFFGLLSFKYCNHINLLIISVDGFHIRLLRH